MTTLLTLCGISLAVWLTESGVCTMPDTLLFTARVAIGMSIGLFISGMI